MARLRSPSLRRAISRGLCSHRGTTHISVNQASRTRDGEGHFPSSPIIVPVAEGSHGNGESLPHWI